MQINTSSQAPLSIDAERLQLQESAQDYLNSQEIQKRIRSILSGPRQATRFNINIDELRAQNPNLAKFVLHHPLEGLKMFEDHLNTLIRNMQDDSEKGKNQKAALAQASETHFPKKVQMYHVNFEGNFG
jgi:DNA replicative helicase MCM subunit Mcm2 (Cdc46/Mcm family)